MTNIVSINEWQEFDTLVEDTNIQFQQKASLSWRLFGVWVLPVALSYQLWHIIFRHVSGCVERASVGVGLPHPHSSTLCWQQSQETDNILSLISGKSGFCKMFNYSLTRLVTYIPTHPLMCPHTHFKQCFANAAVGVRTLCAAQSLFHDRHFVMS